MGAFGRALAASERRWDRGAWATLGVVLGLMLFNIAVTVLVLRQPGEGCLVDHPGGLSQTVRACYGERPTPLRPGDELLAAGDISLIGDEGEFWVREQLPDGWGAGATIDYTVCRGGRPSPQSPPAACRGGVLLTLPAPIDPLPWAGVAEAFRFTASFEAENYLLYAAFLLIFLLAPQSIAARALFVSFGAHFAVTKVGWAGGAVLSATLFGPEWLLPAVFFLTSFWIWIYWPSLLLLVISFPRRVWPVSRAPRAVTALIYAIPVAVGVISLLTRQILPYGIVLLTQIALLLVAFVAVPIDTFMRVRDPVIRAQSGWLLLSLGAYLVPVAILFPVSIFNEAAFDQAIRLLSTPLIYALLTLITPLCLGIAITRYRLFDIDVVIRRTLTYGALTIALVGTYFLSVIGLQSLFVRLTGQESTLAVVASTLAIAALFQPLRTRVQAFIDRRFFRKKYDAQQVLAQFAARAQQEADRDTISADILATVQETLEPEGVRLWLVRRL